MDGFLSPEGHPIGWLACKECGAQLPDERAKRPREESQSVRPR